MNLWISGPPDSGGTFTAINKSVDKKRFFQAVLWIKNEEKTCFFSYFLYR